VKSWMSVSQLAAFSGVSAQTIRTRIKQGKLSSVRVGGVEQIPLEEARAFTASGHPLSKRKQRFTVVKQPED